eukprot:2745347-Prymnesium_polylepis.1
MLFWREHSTRAVGPPSVARAVDTGVGAPRPAAQPTLPPRSPRPAAHPTPPPRTPRPAAHPTPRRAHTPASHASPPPPAGTNFARVDAGPPPRRLARRPAKYGAARYGAPR